MTPRRSQGARSADARSAAGERVHGGGAQRHGPAAALPVIAIVGRPNVGKSTLFNRLVGRRAAIVHDTPGVTRDQNIVAASWNEREFLCVDTGGFDADQTTTGIEALVQRQSRLAIDEADVVVFVFDGRAGVNPVDHDAVDILRRAGRPVIYAVNKIDTPTHEPLVYEFARLGIEPLLPISAEHHRGLDALMDAVLAYVPPAPPLPSSGGGGEVRLALVGRPNVGKSSLLNRLAGAERAIVDPAPGTTRDPIDTSVTLDGRPYILVDTAGIRRRSRVTGGVERLTALRSLRTIERAEIVLLVLDAVEGLTDQDARIAAYALQRGRGLALVVNKWDLVAAAVPGAPQWIATFRQKHPAFTTIPVVCVSAATGWKLEHIPPLVTAVERAFGATLGTRRLNQILRDAVEAQAPPSVRGRAPRFMYVTQVARRPPALAVFTSDPDRIRPTYVRYLQGRFTRAFGLCGTSIRLDFRLRPRR